MSKVPRDKESTTSKKRSRKAVATTIDSIQPENGNGVVHSVQPENGNGAIAQAAASPVAVSQPANTLEEQIRVRAYELYLQRDGNGGSPEQDWLRAQEEISGQGSV